MLGGVGSVGVGGLRGNSFVYEEKKSDGWLRAVARRERSLMERDWSSVCRVCVWCRIVGCVVVGGKIEGSVRLNL